jgi:hypothetical protein
VGTAENMRLEYRHSSLTCVRPPIWVRQVSRRGNMSINVGTKELPMDSDSVMPIGRGSVFVTISAQLT